MPMEKWPTLGGHIYLQITPQYKVFNGEVLHFHPLIKMNGEEISYCLQNLD